MRKGEERAFSASTSSTCHGQKFGSREKGTLSSPASGSGGQSSRGPPGWYIESQNGLG